MFERKTLLVLGALLSNAAFAATYTQAPAGSTLNFTFSQLGAESAGQFKKFTTELQYDEKDPSAGKLQVSVVIDSLDTQDGERDGALRGAELLDVKGHPVATFVSKSIGNSTTGLEAVGTLTLRGVAKEVRLPLKLKPTATGLELTGQARIQRLDFGVGQGEWKSTESVANAVTIQYKVVLVKAK